MDYRQLGSSGLKVSTLSFDTATFGGGTEFFRAWGQTELDEAKRLVDICIESGINLFDTADVYSNGLSEEILGNAIAGKRQNLLISTKTTFRLGEGPNDVGSSGLAKGVASKGVRVNMISPGIIETSGVQKSLAVGSESRYGRRLLSGARSCLE